MKKKISQGAEAVLWQDDGMLVKERVRKGYRIPKLDTKLRKQRTEHEASLLNTARRAGVCTPQVLSVDETTLVMEWVDGKRVKEILTKSDCGVIGKKIGISVGKMHTYDVIHGDLTTSNMILKGNDVFFIDFGLGFQSSKIEDKAVDLYLLYHALESTHWEILETAWMAILDGYRANFGRADEVIKTLSEIEKRGRYKHR